MSNDDSWELYPSRVNDAPASISLNLSYITEPRPTALDSLYVAGIKLEDPDEHGMGSAAEADALLGAEEEFTEKLEAEGFVHVGRLRNDGEWQLSYYAPSGLETEFHGMLALTLATTGRELWTHIDSDPTWDYYDSFLTPDLERSRWMNDRQLVDRLESLGDPLNTPRPVDHAVHLPDRAAAQALVAAAEPLGFTSRIDDGASEQTLVELKREDPVNLSHIHEVVTEIVDLAAQHGGEYDGWGCALVKGQPR